LFIFFQQLVIVDVSYQWNESWVDKSNTADREEGPGKGQKWLYAILTACTILFTATAALLIYTIIMFRGCGLNNTVIAISVLLIIAILTAQLSGTEGSLLTSACVSAWTSYLCYAAVSKNPDVACNPNSGEGTIFSMILGLSITMMSLLWTGWSYTAADTLRNNDNDEDDDNAVPSAKSDKPKPTTVGGIVVGANDDDVEADTRDNDDPPGATAAGQQRTSHGNVTNNSWRLNIVLAVIACWAAMTLTHWGQVQGNDGIIANPSVGKVSLWMMVVAQWLVLSIYLWTLLAPRLFPNRDFS
jgi:serine incorporator 1/3